MSGPLSGLRVVDWSTGMAAPRAAGMLADYGADVVRIEPPGGDPWAALHAAPYSVFNRGKRRLELDLDSPDDRAALIDLIRHADVLIEGWPQPRAVGLGLGYDDLHAVAPQLVYCSISGFGTSSDRPDRRAYESLVHAVVGTMAEQPGVRPGPIFEGLPFASIGAAYLACIGVVGSLLRRHDDGHGRHVETSLLDGALSFLTMLWGDADDPPSARDPGSKRLIARNFDCSDGEILGVHTGAVGAFGRLMIELGLDDRIPPSEDGLDMGISLEPEQRTLLDQKLPEIFASDTRENWVQRLTAVDVCAIPLLPPMEVFDQPQVVHNAMVLELKDPQLGVVQQVAPALRFNASGAPAPSAMIDVQPEAIGWSERAEPAPGGAADTRPLLAGLKVLDLGAFYAGPYGSRLLADLGADVIRVETLGGDPNRGSEVIFRSSHAGMRSISVDLKTDEGRAIVEGLVRWADVVHHSMRPGAAERLGLGYEQVRAINSDAIYAYGPGWGSTGPNVARQSFAPLVSGFVGSAFEVAGQFNPPLYPVGNEDPANGMLGALAMLLGVWHRRTAGQAQYVEHPQLNAALAQMAHIVRRPDGEPLNALRLDPVQLGYGPLDRLYPTADGWVCLVATTLDEIDGLVQALAIEAPTTAPIDELADRDAPAGAALESAIAQAIQSRTTSDVLAAFAAAGVSAVEPVGEHNACAFLRDPANLASGRSGQAPHPTRGQVREVGLLIRATDAADAPHRLAPGLGEHTDEIVTSLGYSTDEIASLRARRAIR